MSFPRAAIAFQVYGEEPIRLLPDDPVLLDFASLYKARGESCTEEASWVSDYKWIGVEATGPNPPLQIPVLPYVFPIHPELVR
ncbi:hypothetical protein ACFL6C_03540 [Myxococcota bacterium]